VFKPGAATEPENEPVNEPTNDDAETNVVTFKLFREASLPESITFFQDGILYIHYRLVTG
jgi:hypothetical protein